MKKFIKLFLAILMVLCLVGCQNNDKKEDIVILYTNDVHCGIDENIGYAGLAAYKKYMQTKSDYVTLVDCGDAIQGDVIGSVSNGEYLVDIMNEIGYDYAIFGNHEFDYGMGILNLLLNEAKAQYLACNIKYSGTKGNALEKTKAYDIKTYGDKKVAFVGVATPESITKSTPTYFQEDGKYVYTFSGASAEELFSTVQATVDEAKKAGADYVIVLSHLGDDEASEPFTSTNLVAKTNGIDVVLDGHSHSVVASRILQNKDGANVTVSSTGTKLEYIGQLVIAKDGVISTTLVSYNQVDEAAGEFVSTIKASYEETVNKVVASSEIDLLMKKDGVRVVRNRESELGNLCADAYRVIGNADIGILNGGGIRNTISKGDITYANIISVNPYGNMLTVVKATGQEIVDALEMASRSCQAVASKDGNAVGENGGFINCSGMKYTIDTSIASTIETDEFGNFKAVGGARRVCDVQVMDKDGNYQPIDLTKEYTVACHNYMLKSGGDGINMFMDNEIVVDESMSDYQVLITYITDYLGGTIKATDAKIEGRITVK